MPPSIVRAVSMLQSSPTPEGRRCYVMGHVTGCHMELPKAATPTRDLPADRAEARDDSGRAGGLRESPVDEEVLRELRSLGYVP